MNELIINNIFTFIKNNTNHSEYELLKIKYGLEGVYLTITKTFIIIFIGIIFKYLDVVILTLIFFNIIRFFAFGLHAKKSYQCLILSILEFNILPYIFSNIDISIILIIIISIFSFISILLFAPSDTEKRPLTNKKKRIIRKVLSLIICLIYILLAFKLKSISHLIICALLIESIMINPITYKLLGLKYNNYKRAKNI